jgi:hypothetical protein
VFAISGVSGGSLGAAVFAALVKRTVRNATHPPCRPELIEEQGPMQRAVDEVLRHDLLAPVVAGTLFPDLAQRFIPWPIPALDRARMFEHAVERAWVGATGGTEFSEPFESLRTDARAGAVPALLLNTTNVETGLRMVVSHLELCDERFGRLATLADINRRITMPLSAAVGLSARFPIVASSGAIPDSRESVCSSIRGTTHFVDGGYFENSGTTTLLDLINILGLATSSPPHDFALHIITIGAWESLPRYEARGFEVLSPIKTLLNTREGRGTVAREQLLTNIHSLGTLPGSGRWQTGIFEFGIRPRKVPVPLGWVLSSVARHEIISQLKDQNRCGRPGDLRDLICVDNVQAFTTLVRDFETKRR